MVVVEQGKCIAWGFGVGEEKPSVFSSSLHRCVRMLHEARKLHGLCNLECVSLILGGMPKTVRKYWCLCAFVAYGAKNSVFQVPKKSWKIDRGGWFSSPPF